MYGEEYMMNRDDTKTSGLLKNVGRCRPFDVWRRRVVAGRATKKIFFFFDWPMFLFLHIHRAFCVAQERLDCQRPGTVFPNYSKSRE